MLNLICFFLLASGVPAHAVDPVLRAALSATAEIIDLPAPLQTQLEAYFDRIYDKILLPSEANIQRPRPILVVPSQPGVLAFVRRDHPEYVFWSAGFFKHSPSMDIDLFVAAHEFRHTQAANHQFEDIRTAEYDADLYAIIERLFRVGQRDPETKQPQAAVADAETLVRWTKSTGYQEHYIDGNALASVVTIAFGRERFWRPFPKGPTARTGISEILEYLGTLQTVPVMTRRNETGDTKKKILSIAARLRRDPIASLIILDEIRRSNDAGTPLGDLKSQLIEFKALKMRLEIGINHGDDKTLSPQTFDRLGALSKNFFNEWEALQQRVAIQERLLFSSDGEARKYDLSESFATPESFAKFFITPLSLTPFALAIGVSRLFDHQVEEGSLTKDPLRDFTLIAFDALLRQTFSKKGANSQIHAAWRANVGAQVIARQDAAALARDLTKIAGNCFARENIKAILRAVNIDEVYPGLRTELLFYLPRVAPYASIRALLELPQDIEAYLRDLVKSDPPEFIKTMIDLSGDATAKQFKHKGLWLDFLRGDIGPNGYVKELYRAPGRIGRLQAYQIHRQSEYTTYLELDHDLARDTIDAITARVIQSFDTFFHDWERVDQLHYWSELWTLTDWSRVFAVQSLEALRRFVHAHPDFLTKDELSLTPLRHALAGRILRLVEEDERLTGATLNLAITALNLSATRSDASRRTLEIILERLARDRSPAGQNRRLLILRRIRPVNFDDARSFAKTYAEALMWAIDPSGQFTKLPLAAIRYELDDVKHRFEPQTAARILAYLATTYRATPDQKSVFTISSGANVLNVATIAAWDQFIVDLTDDDLLRLRDALARGVPIDPARAWRYQLALFGAKIPAPSDAVDAAIAKIFAEVGIRRQRQFFVDPLTERPEDMSGHPMVPGFRRQIEAKSHDDRRRFMDFLATHANFKTTFARDVTTQRKHVPTAVEDFHIWYDLSKVLSDEQLANLIGTLRGETHLDSELKFELGLRLARAGVSISTNAIETYVSRRFLDLEPFERAGVFKVLLDGAKRRLDDPRFRAEIFEMIFQKLPKGATRSTFLDLWTAGMSALPNTIRSLVLAVALSESGRSGSPERALVTLLANMGPLEQKFGQALAFADLPESYRRELRELWDSAQNLQWWEAWELLDIQHGDLRSAGYRLTRIMNSGSTTAYLEVTHDESRRRLVVPVYRDGIAHSVHIGAEQLRTFAKTLVAMDSRRYGFLPLLVEDSIRTMQRELDPNLKRHMTNEMAMAYRRAARTLRLDVDADGAILHDGWKFTNLPFVDITLDQGKIVHAQELADGVSLKQLKEINRELYLKITRDILRLENTVNQDPTAPVDKDRMPGQYIVSLELKTVFILDHGQATHLDASARAVFSDFTRYAFAADLKRMGQIVHDLTGVTSKIAGGPIRNAEISSRPLTYLAAIAPQFLAMSDQDARKTLFFDLLHGVRAELRLLQWESSEGLSDLKNQATARILGASNGPKLWVATAFGKISALIASIKRWWHFRRIDPVEHMEASFVKPLAPCEDELTKSSPPVDAVPNAG